jgi:tetratricopeptide (TPR) repeat protein/TolB-like protein
LNLENNGNNRPNPDSQKPEPRTPRARLFRSLLPALILALVIVVIYILKIWKFDPEYKREAAAENRLAVMYFDNKVDPADPGHMGEIIAGLLTTDLSQSKYMNVVSGQRMYDVLKQLGLDSTKIIDKNTAVEIAGKTGARWILFGGLTESQQSSIINCQLVDAKSGDLMATLNASGGKGASVFTLVDELTAKIKKNLPLPSAAEDEPDLPVADVTTHSLEAYRDYIIGVKYIYKYFWTNARHNLSQAVHVDSTFASAYARLAFVADDAKFQRQMIDKAVAYADKVVPGERYFIYGLDGYITQDYDRAVENFDKLVELVPDDKTAYYYLALINRQAFGKNKKAVDYLNKLIKLDPDYIQAYNLMAYAYDAMGEFDNALKAINEYISLLPDKANPYDSRGDIYAYNGYLDSAISSYKKALQVQPDFEATPGKLGNMYLFKHEYTRAESLFNKEAESDNLVTRSFGRASLTDIMVYQGKFKKALEHWNYCIKTDSTEIGPGRIISNRIMTRIELYIRLNMLKEAAKEVKRLSDFHARNDESKDWIHIVKGYDAWMAALEGDSIKADTILDGMALRIGKKSTPLLNLYEQVRARVNFVEGHFAAARSYFEKENAIGPSFENEIMIARCMMGEVEFAEAAAMFEKALTRYDFSRAYNGIFAAKAHYWLGLTYEQLGRTDKAVAQYEIFLDTWKNADPGITEVADARKRLTKLKSNT